MECFPKELLEMRTWADDQIFCYNARKTIAKFIIRCKVEGDVFCRFVIGFHGDVFCCRTAEGRDPDGYLKCVVSMSDNRLHSTADVAVQRKVLETLKGELDAIYGQAFKTSLSDPTGCIQLLSINLW